MTKPVSRTSTAVIVCAMSLMQLTLLLFWLHDTKQYPQTIANSDILVLNSRKKYQRYLPNCAEHLHSGGGKRSNQPVQMARN